ncbi:MAG: radical SAM protein [Deltaproteobacteria bacterium]|nr:radical SAM protein [Deltaproteobacteria bacterium]
MIKAIDYSAFSLSLHEAALQKDIPLDGTLELTAHCNLNCVHCYIRDDSRKDELTYTEICRILDEITDAGCLWLLLTGGEPLVRKDFFDIYKYAKQKGLIITLFTNGTLITEETAIFLKKWTPFSVEITLYGATREVYEAMTGAPGSYDACVNGIKLLVKHGVPLSLKTMVTTINKHELLEIKRFAEGLGLKFRYDPIINPRLDGSKSPYDVRVTADEVVEFDINDEERTREWIELYEKFYGPASAEHLFNCGVGKSSFHITPSGRLQVCELVPRPDYDLRRNSFVDGYSLFPGIRSKRLKGAETCAGCEYILICDNCPGFSMLEGDNDGERPVDYHCRTASKRAGHIKMESDYGKEKNLQET